MTLPASGPISMEDLRAEYYSIARPIPLRTPLTEYNRGGDYVPDQGAGFPNEDVPTAPPMKLTDYYEGEGASNPVQITNTTIPAATDRYKFLLLSTRPEGVFVAPRDPTLETPNSDSNFCIEARFRCTGSESDDEFLEDDSTWGNTYFKVGALLGLTQLDPLVHSEVPLGNSLAAMCCWVDYMRTQQTRGYAQGRGVVPYRFSESSGSDYRDNVMPSNGPFDYTDTTLRVSRGRFSQEISPGLWTSEWYTELIRENGTVWLTRRTYSSSGANDFGGWLAMANRVWGVDPGQGILIDYVRAVAGSAYPTW